MLSYLYNVGKNHLPDEITFLERKQVVKMANKKQILMAINFKCEFCKKKEKISECIDISCPLYRYRNGMDPDSAKYEKINGRMIYRHKKEKYAAS
jgi:hypothetical protein